MNQPSGVMVENLIRAKIKKMDSINGLDGDYVYSYGIPDNIHGDEIDKIVILVSEISQQPNVYGSDFPTEERTTIQVQFFYPLMSDVNYYEDVEKPILHDLLLNGWRRTLGGGHDRDPDTKQIYTTYHIVKSVDY